MNSLDNKKYIIPDAAEEWVLKTIRDARRKYKNDLYKKHYKLFDNDELRIAKKPADISESDFKDLLKYWDSEKFKKMSETNTKNRKKLKNPHTAGKTSFSIIRNKLAEMEKIQSQQGENGSDSVDVFETVMGPGNPEYVRLYGKGVTKKSLKRKRHHEPSLSSTDDDMLQNKLEDLEERMTETLEQQKTSIRQEVTFDIIGRLKSMYPGLQLDANMFETTSNSNIQGGEDNQGDDESIEDLI